MTTTKRGRARDGNVSNRKLVSDTKEVMEAALNCMLWISDLKLFTTCMRRNIEYPVLANRFIREFKKGLKKELDNLYDHEKTTLPFTASCLYRNGIRQQ